MISVERAVEYVQNYLKNLGITITPEHPNLILFVLDAKAKQFLGDSYTLSGKADIETDGSDNYLLPAEVHSVTQVDIDDYKIMSKITEREIKVIKGEVL